MAFFGFGGDKKKKDASDGSSSDEVLNDEEY